MEVPIQFVILNSYKTVLGVLIAILVVLSMIAPVFASTEPGHTKECSYVKGDPGSKCNFVPEQHLVHDAACGYKAPIGGSPCSAEANHTHDAACGYKKEILGADCENELKHNHDFACGYVKEVLEVICTASKMPTDLCIPATGYHAGQQCNFFPAVPCSYPANHCETFASSGHVPGCTASNNPSCGTAGCISARGLGLKGRHISDCQIADEKVCTVYKPANQQCRKVASGAGSNVTHTGQKCEYVAPVKGVDCKFACDHKGDCGYVKAVKGVECGFVCEHKGDCGYVKADPGAECKFVPEKHEHDNQCGYKAPVAEVKCDCKLGGVVTFTHRIPVSFKPERDSARAPNNTWFAFDYTLGRDSNYADTSFVTGGYGGGGYNNWGFGGRRAPGYGRGYGSSNGVASGYIEITAEAGNYVLTVTRVAIKGYTINPASVTIRFTILENGKIRFNTYATRADFTYKRDDVVKKPAHNNPKTGDATNIALWSSMAVTSMAGVVVALKKRVFK